MDSNKRKKIRKIAIISAGSIAGLCLVLVIVAYLVIHSYIGKMNLVNDDDENIIYDDLLTQGYDEASDGYDDTYYTGLVAEDDINQNASDSMDKPVDSEGSNDISVLNLTDEETTDKDQEEEDNSSAEEIKNLEASIAENISDDTELMEDDGVFNVLLIGSDTTSEGDRGRSDSMILLSLNKDKDTIIVTSLLRDIYLKIPGKEYNRLNTAYSYGGPKLLMKTIEDNFKIKVDRYIQVDFYAFIDIINAIGGVTLEVTDDEVQYINRYIRGTNRRLGIDEETDCVNESGVIHLNGKQALGYARIRYIGTDFGRTERQRKILNYIFNEIKGLSLLQYNDLLNEILPLVTTNMKEKEIFSHLLSLHSYLEYDFVHWSVPIKDSYTNLKVRGMSVLGIDFEKNIKELQNKIYRKDR